MSDKIVSLDKATKLVKEYKTQGKTIVTYNGSFDILHAGHVRAIHQAKQQGDLLIILLNSDKSVKSYKGPGRPILPEEDRAELVAALQDVGYVVLFDEINPSRALAQIKPDIHCKSPDWGKDCVERAAVEESGGEIYLLGWTEGRSTTDIIKKIIEVESTPSVRAVFIDRDGIINDNKDGYIYKQEDFEFLPGVIEGLKRLSQTDYKIIIITNQSGISRKMYTEEDFHKLNDWLLAHLLENGVRIDKVYYCHHHPKDRCDCRKPGIGMFLKAVENFGIRLDKSWLIGDSDSDVQAGRSANIKTIKVGNKVNPELKLKPNHYAIDLDEAVDIILK